MINKKIPDIHIVAEDLGDLREEVFELRDHYGLSGMKIVQFELDPYESNNDLKKHRIRSFIQGLTIIKL